MFAHNHPQVRRELESQARGERDAVKYERKSALHGSSNDAGMGAHVPSSMWGGLGGLSLGEKSGGAGADLKDGAGGQFGFSSMVPTDDATTGAFTANDNDDNSGSDSDSSGFSKDSQSMSSRLKLDPHSAYKDNTRKSKSSNNSSRRRGSRPYGTGDLKTRRKMRKNTREKQRRQELNDKFDHLCRLLNLGRKAKTEKFTVLSEAVNLITTLRTQNDYLKKEKEDLSKQLAKVTSCLQSAFPAQPPEQPVGMGMGMGMGGGMGMNNMNMNNMNMGGNMNMDVSAGYFPDGRRTPGPMDLVSPLMANNLPPLPRIPSNGSDGPIRGGSHNAPFPNSFRSGFNQGANQGGYAGGSGRGGGSGGSGRNAGLGGGMNLSGGSAGRMNVGNSSGGSRRGSVNFAHLNQNLMQTLNEIAPPAAEFLGGADDFDMSMDGEYDYLNTTSFS